MNTGAVGADFMVGRITLAQVWILWWIELHWHRCGFYGG
jgi:hypothetical protein